MVGRGSSQTIITEAKHLQAGIHLHALIHMLEVSPVLLSPILFCVCLLVSPKRRWRRGTYVRAAVRAYATIVTVRRAAASYSPFAILKRKHEWTHTQPEVKMYITDDTNTKMVEIHQRCEKFSWSKVTMSSYSARLTLTLLLSCSSLTFKTSLAAA